MNDLILPILKAINSSQIYVNLLHELSKTILLLEHPEESMEKFKDIVIEIVKIEDIRELISKFMKEPAVFKSSPSIRALCEYRRKWLENKISQKAEFSWHMPDALLPRYPQVENFLRSDRINMELIDVFGDIDDARRFASSYNYRVQNGFSINSVPNGSGRNAYVTITKTRDYYDQQERLFTQFAQEMQEITHFIN
jgi:hypothetical protein